MGRKAQISLVTVVFAAIGVALLAYWYDSTQKDQIAEGVTIGGVDVGGLDAEAAASQVRTNLITPLEKTVKVKYGEETFELTAKELDVRTDIDGMVDEALAASREGSLPGRVWRGVSGGEVNEAIRPQVDWNKDEVDHFINHVANNIGRDPVDASIDPSGGQLIPVAAKPGIALDEGSLREQVEDAIDDPAQRTVKPQVEKVKPEVTTAEVADKYPTYIVVDRANFQVTLYRNLKEETSYTVAIGAEGYDTPTGLYHIQNKQVDPVWSVPDSDWAGELAGQTIPPGPDNPLKARWMGIYDGAGFHGTSDVGSLGSAASHGCVRMAVEDVIDLYDRVEVGTPVYIQ
jgi:lipoprotein-anchoring transpeptidase ErfK/SrfK